MANSVNIKDTRPPECGICLYRGDDNTFKFTLRDAEGNAIDISQDAIKFTVKSGRSADANCLVPTITMAPTDLQADAAVGCVRFAVSAAMTNAASPAGATTCGYYEVRRCKDIVGGQAVYISGPFIIKPSIGTCT